jgi:hypothetical protein
MNEVRRDVERFTRRERIEQVPAIERRAHLHVHAVARAICGEDSTVGIVESRTSQRRNAGQFLARTRQTCTAIRIDGMSEDIPADKIP